MQTPYPGPILPHWNLHIPTNKVHLWHWSKRVFPWNSHRNELKWFLTLTLSTANTQSYYQYLQIILSFGLSSLDMPLILQLQGMRNNLISFKTKTVAKAKIVDHGQLRTCYCLETGYLDVVFYRTYSLFPCAKDLVNLKTFERKAAGMIQKVWNVFCLGNNWVHQALLSGKEMTEGGCRKKATKSWEMQRG